MLHNSRPGHQMLTSSALNYLGDAPAHKLREWSHGRHNIYELSRQASR